MPRASRKPPKPEVRGKPASPEVPWPAAPAAEDALAAGVDLATESVAGEEDPGAALDLLWPAPPAA